MARLALRWLAVGYNSGKYRKDSEHGDGEAVWHSSRSGNVPVPGINQNPVHLRGRGGNTQHYQQPIEALPKAVCGRPGSVAAYSDTKRNPRSQKPSPTVDCHPCATLIAMPHRRRAKMNARSGEHPLHTGATKRSKVRTFSRFAFTRGG